MIFTEDSNILLKYIKTKVKSSRNYKEYKELFDSLKKVYFSVNILKIQDTSNAVANVESPFLSDNIRENLKLLTQHKYVYFETNNSMIHLNVYYTNCNLRKFLNRIIEAICFLFNMSDHNMKECTINYYLTDNKKLLQDKNYLEDHLSHKEVNSGSCSSDTINIWRKEEVLKVTIHEVIHLLDYDFKRPDSIIKEHYKRKYDVSSENLSIFEAYTETWANLINIYLIVKNTKNYKEGLKKFSQFIEYERFFIHYQACKIFYITGLCEKMIDIDKHTNVLPYYIIRNEFFSNLRDFLNYCKKNNSNYIKLKKNFNEYLFDTIKCKKNNRFFTNKSKNSFVYKTTRMSSIELNLFS